MWRQGSLVRAALCALPALYLADTPEGMDVANISGKTFPIVNSMVPASQLADSHAEHPPRTESAMQQFKLCLAAASRPQAAAHEGLPEVKGTLGRCQVQQMG